MGIPYGNCGSKGAEMGLRERKGRTRRGEGVKKMPENVLVRRKTDRFLT